MKKPFKSGRSEFSHSCKLLMILLDFRIGTKKWFKNNFDILIWVWDLPDLKISKIYTSNDFFDRLPKKLTLPERNEKQRERASERE